MDGEDSATDTPHLDVVHISIEDARDSKACVGHDRDTLALMIQEHREVMHNLAEIQGKSPKSLVMSVAKYEAIVHHLQHPTFKVEPHFKHWVKTRKFQLLDLPEEDERQVLVIAKDKVDKWGFNSSFLRVVHAGHLSDLVYKTHAEELQHCGYKRVLEKLQRRYFGVTRVYVQEFCKSCPVCKLKPHHSAAVGPQGQSPEARTQPRVERHGFFQDMAHIDLIDMRHSPDGEYRYIGHFMDEYSRFHVLFPMKRKAAPELSRLLEERVLGYFGPPKVFYGSEGVEIANRLVTTTLEKWDDKVNFVDRHSRTSRSGRVMERSRQAILDRLADIRENEMDSRRAKHYPWASWLPRVMFTINSECQESARDSPYFSVYGCSSPVLMFTEERCQGQEEPLDSDGEQELDARGREGVCWGPEAVAATGDEEETHATESGFDTTLQEQDHNYITTITATSKRFKMEPPDYDEDD
ncbi:SCAN domain-containing protein 3-like isoform X1 [Portunus trituberculatus]|uniref:SCAN domain-containing protein 3-like isoform X1 n=1 Tax=Portunus trituberculatus TaxID=210409 RepID=UPI001E1CDB49|nr:SCAN domain-containing protein 3-like isoform X1 [Portunus trituberculatus]XP_045116046.1 SCAN domain-containing protein 3-like isoform X1 [Portunus trituberculatus]XP_045116047.1 SCAN domain-containing protein 3-like isoform X1 [Portunus trituberculatus]